MSVFCHVEYDRERKEIKKYSKDDLGKGELKTPKEEYRVVSPTPLRETKHRMFMIRMEWVTNLIRDMRIAETQKDLDKISRLMILCEKHYVDLLYEHSQLDVDIELQKRGYARTNNGFIKL